MLVWLFSYIFRIMFINSGFDVCDMPKRRALKKQKAKLVVQDVKVGSAGYVRAAMPIPAVALKILAIVLGLILIIALTLYISNRMPAKGFWTLAILLALIAFVVMPVIRKRYVKE